MSTNAERQARHRAKVREELRLLRNARSAHAGHELTTALARIARLEQALADAQARLAQYEIPRNGIPRTAEEMDRRREEVKAANAKTRIDAKVAGAQTRSAESPETVESLRVMLDNKDRQIRGHITRERNLRITLREMERYLSRKGITALDENGYRLILSCLHPDRMQTPKEKRSAEEAMKLFQNLGLKPPRR